MSMPHIPGRYLRLNLKKIPWAWYFGTTPYITINGAPMPAQWGEGTLVVPAADTHIGVYLDQYNLHFGRAEYVLRANESPTLEYKAPAFGFSPGDLGQPGTVRHRGKAVPIVLLSIMGFVVLLLVGFLVAIAVATTR